MQVICIFVWIWRLESNWRAHKILFEGPWPLTMVILMIEIMWSVVSGKYCLQLRTPIWRPSATVIQLQSPKLRHLFNVYLLWVQILSSTYILCETRQSLHVQMSTALKTQSSTTSSYWVLQDVDKGGTRLQYDQPGGTAGVFPGNTL